MEVAEADGLDVDNLGKFELIVDGELLAGEDVFLELRTLATRFGSSPRDWSVLASRPCRSLGSSPFSRGSRELALDDGGADMLPLLEDLGE